MFLRHGSLACLYFIALLSLIQTCALARSTSSLPFASAVWGSSSISPSLEPTSSPFNPKKRRHSKRRRRVSNQKEKPNIKYDDRDDHKPKKRTNRRKRKVSPRATQDLSSSFSHERGSAARPSVAAGRTGSKSNPRVNRKKTKRRRASLAIEAERSTEPTVRKTKKRIRRKSSKTVPTTVPPPEKRKDDSDLAIRKKKGYKRRKHVAVGSQSPPESTLVKGSYKKKQKVKRTKKLSVVSTKRVSDGAEPEETEEASIFASLQFLTKDKFGRETSLMTDDSKVNFNVPTNQTTVVERDDNSAPTISHFVQLEPKEEDEEASVEDEGFSSVPTNVSVDRHKVDDIPFEAEQTSSTPKSDLMTDDIPEDANAKVSSYPTVNSNSIAEVQDVIGEVDRVLDLQGPKEMTTLTSFENEVANNEAERKQQVDDKEFDEVNVSATKLDEYESIADEFSVEAKAAIQTESRLEELCAEAPIDEENSKKQEPKANEGATRDKDVDSKTKDDPAKEDDGVVDFIQDILQEDVKSWVNDPSSDDPGLKSTSAVNSTRGGHQSASTSTNDEVNNDETKEPSTEKKNLTVSSSEDTTKDTESLDSSLLESYEDCETDITVSVVTWNLAEISPTEEDAAFIRKFRKSGTKKGSGSDLVLISGQECENIKPRRSEGSRSREYRRLMIKMLGKEYVPIALHLLGGIQFGLFAKRSFLKEIEEIAIADVTCGIGNVFHNKGAIAAFLKVKARNPSLMSNKAKSLRMVFVTAHMAAHVKNIEARNSDFWRISSELEAQAPDGFLLGHEISTDLEHESFLFNSADRVFFCGDLNYRVDLPRELTEFQTLKQGLNKENKELYSELMYHDQLKATMCENQAFPGFAEGRIAFPPTFKFDKETGSYDTSHKQRIPAWTDRILFKPFGTRVLEYTSVPEAQHSDHRPVHGTFRVSMEGRDLPSKKSRTQKRHERRRQSDTN